MFRNWFKRRQQQPDLKLPIYQDRCALQIKTNDPQDNKTLKKENKELRTINGQLRTELELSRKEKERDIKPKMDLFITLNDRHITEVNKLKNTNKVLLQDVEARTRELRETKSTLEEMKMENLQLQRDLEALRASKKKEERDLKLEICEMAQRLKKASEENATLQNRLDKAKRTVRQTEGETLQDGVDAQSENNALRDQVRTLQSELNKFKSKCASLAEENQIFETKNEHLTLTISVQDEDIQTLMSYKEKCASLTKKNDPKDYKNLKKENKELRKINRQLRTELELSRTKNKRDLELQVDWLTNFNVRVLTEVSKLKNTNMVLLQDAEAQTRELRETKSILEEREMENLQLQRDLKALRASKKKEEQEIRDMAQRLKEAAEENATLQKLLDKAKRTGRDLRKIISEQNEDIQMLTSYKEKCASLIKKIKLLQRLNEDCRDGNEEVQDDLEEVNIAISKVARLEKKLEVLEAKNVELGVQNHELKRCSQYLQKIRESEKQNDLVRIQKLHIDLRELAADCLSLKKVVEHMEQKNQELSDLSHDLRHVQAVPCNAQVVDALKNRIRSLTGQNHELEKRNQTLKANLQNLNRIENSFGLLLLSNKDLRENLHPVLSLFEQSIVEKI